MSTSNNSPSGSLLRAGAGLILIAIGLKWIAGVLQNAWPWLAGGLVAVMGICAVVAWWRRRSLW